MSTKNKLYKFKENETFAVRIISLRGVGADSFLGMTTLLFWNWVAVRVNIPCNLQSSLLRRISLV